MQLIRVLKKMPIKLVTSWFKIIVSGILICMFSIMQSSASIAAGGDGLQVYQQNNVHLSPERKEKLAQDIDRYHNADNIWDTMRSEFTLPHYEDNPRVQNSIDYYMNNQDELYLAAQRAAPYLYYILQQVRERHLPAEVALLPIIESDYNPNNTSSVGAAGIWQLMPATASDEGIKQNSWYDGRRDVVASTKAALNHLAYLSNFFDGNWLLATAAYDTGEGNVLSAIKRNEFSGNNTDYWNLPLSKETRAYVPKLMALAVIISNPKKYPVQLPYVSNAPYLAQVDVGPQISLKQAATLAGLSLPELKHLNSGIKNVSSTPSSAYKLLLPIENVEEFTENLADKTGTTTTPQDTIDFIHHKVKHGETLASLADKFNTSVDNIKRINPDITTSVKSGMNIIIPEENDKTNPSPSKAANAVEMAYNDGKNSDKTPDIKGAPTSVDPSFTVSTSPNLVKVAIGSSNYSLQPGDTLYMVRQGDTIDKIAKRFHTTNDILRNSNKSSQHFLAVGSEVVIPTHNKDITPSPSSKYTISPGDTIYMVRKHDTIEKIASRYHTSVAQLKVVNLLVSNSVKPGERLVIPTHV